MEDKEQKDNIRFIDVDWDEANKQIADKISEVLNEESIINKIFK